MTPEEILREAEDKAQNYPGDRLCLTGAELLEFATYMEDVGANQLCAELRAEVDNRANRYSADSRSAILIAFNDAMMYVRATRQFEKQMARVAKESKT